VPVGVVVVGEFEGMIDVDTAVLTEDVVEPTSVPMVVGLLDDTALLLDSAT
jgi:hypothetical protein